MVDLGCLIQCANVKKNNNNNISSSYLQEKIRIYTINKNII